MLSVDGWDGSINGFGDEKAREVSIRPAMWVYTDQALAEGWRTGAAELPADEVLNTSLASLHTGDEIDLGLFPDRDWRDGKQAIRWKVLDETEDALLLCAVETFGTEQFSQTDDESVTWETSYLRSLLNSDSFINRYFNPWERSKIRLTHSSTSSGDPVWERSGGADTDDYLFLLDQEEVLRYFPEEAERIVSDVNYWLRDPDFAPGFFSLVTYQGTITTDQAVSRYGIRPTMWVEK